MHQVCVPRQSLLNIRNAKDKSDRSKRSTEYRYFIWKQTLQTIADAIIVMGRGRLGLDALVGPKEFGGGICLIWSVSFILYRMNARHSPHFSSMSGTPSLIFTNTQASMETSKSLSSRRWHLSATRYSVVVRTVPWDVASHGICLWERSN